MVSHRANWLLLQTRRRPLSDIMDTVAPGVRMYAYKGAQVSDQSTMACSNWVHVST